MLRRSALLWLALVAFVCVLPMVLRGIVPTAHDLVVHWVYAGELKAALLRGDLYPRWFPSMNEGQGSPIFLIQYPLPYYALVLMHWLIGSARWTITAFTFVFLFLSGLTSYRWLRFSQAPAAALFGAVVYMVLPFHLANGAYSRWGIGELCATAVLPLIFVALEPRQDRVRAWIEAALVFALLILCHLPTFLLALPLVLIYVPARRDAQAAWRAAAGLAFAVLLCAAYVARLLLHLPQQMLVPAVYYKDLYIFLDNHFFDLLRQWIGWLPAGAGVTEWLRGRLVYEASVRSPSVWPLVYALGSTWLAMAVLVLVLSVRRRWDRWTAGAAALACATTFLTLPWSDGLVELFPAIQAIQFPSRFLVIHSLCAAYLGAAAIDGWRSGARRLAAAGIVLAILGGGNAAMMSRMPFVHDVGPFYLDTMFRSYGGKLTSVALSHSVAPMQPIPGRTDRKGRQLLNLLGYPGWEVSTAGSGWKPLDKDPETNLCVLERGTGSYWLRFEAGPWERLGGAISLASLAAAVLLWVRGRRSTGAEGAPAQRGTFSGT